MSGLPSFDRNNRLGKTSDDGVVQSLIVTTLPVVNVMALNADKNHKPHFQFTDKCTETAICMPVFVQKQSHPKCQSSWTGEAFVTFAAVQEELSDYEMNRRVRFIGCLDSPADFSRPNKQFIAVRTGGAMSIIVEQKGGIPIGANVAARTMPAKGSDREKDLSKRRKYNSQLDKAGCGYFEQADPATMSMLFAEAIRVIYSNGDSMNVGDVHMDRLKKLAELGPAYETAGTLRALAVAVSFPIIAMLARHGVIAIAPPAHLQATEDRDMRNTWVPFGGVAGATTPSSETEHDGRLNSLAHFVGIAGFKNNATERELKGAKLARSIVSFALDPYSPVTPGTQSQTYAKYANTNQPHYQATKMLLTATPDLFNRFVRILDADYRQQIVARVINNRDGTHPDVMLL